MTEITGKWVDAPSRQVGLDVTKRTLDIYFDKIEMMLRDLPAGWGIAVSPLRVDDRDVTKMMFDALPVRPYQRVTHLPVDFRIYGPLKDGKLPRGGNIGGNASD